MYEYDFKNFDEIKGLMDPNILDTTEMRMTVNVNGHNGYHFDKDEQYGDGYIYTPIWDSQETNNGGRPFHYRVNKNGFRSQHFDNFNPADKNILIGGCSNSVGIGLPEELVWGSVIADKIQEKFPDQSVQKYNVSVGGSSIPFILKNVLAFLRKYDGVDYVFILLPGFDRHVSFDEDNRPLMFKKIVYMGPDAENFKYKFVKRFVLNYSHEEAMFMQLPLVKAIEDICELKNIKLVWSTWRTSDQRVYESYDFNNYCHIPQEILNYEMFIDGDYEYEKIARDSMHPGSKWMNAVADRLFEAAFNG